MSEFPADPPYVRKRYVSLENLGLSEVAHGSKVSPIGAVDPSKEKYPFIFCSHYSNEN